MFPVGQAETRCCRIERMTEEALRPARIIWEYHQLRHHPIPADVIVALGHNGLRVSEFAADLYQRGYGSTLVCTGGVAHCGDLLETRWEKTEAEMFADATDSLGTPCDQILRASGA